MIQVPTSDLRPNPISEQLYGEITSDPQFNTLKLLIEKEGIREPLVITESNFIISGVRRYMAAVELSIDSVPVIYSDVLENEVDDLMIIMHQQHRNKTAVQIFREIEYLNEQYNLKKKGRPSSKNATEQEIKARGRKKELISSASKQTFDRLQKAKENLLKVYDDKKKVEKELNKMEQVEGLKPLAIMKKSKKILADFNKEKKSTNSYSNANANSHKFKILKHDSRMEFSPEDIKDKSVSCIITSPPYAYAIRNYETGKNQIGHEKQLDDYINSLVKVFRNCKRVLMDTGSLFINIADSIQDGNLQNVPAKLAEALKKDGWIYNSNIIWLRVNPTFQDNKRPVPSYEHILHFTLNKDFNYYTDWIKGDIINDRMYYGDMGKVVRLRDFWDGRNQIIECPVANNQKLSNHLLNEGHDLTHSATFPVEVALAIINSVNKPNDGGIIMDCFNGLATTGLAALNEGYYYIGVDNNPVYIEQSNARLNKFIEDQDMREKKQKKETEDNELRVVHSVSKRRKKNNKVVEFDYVKNDSYSLSNQPLKKAS